MDKFKYIFFIFLILPYNFLLSQSEDTLNMNKKDNLIYPISDTSKLPFDFYKIKTRDNISFSDSITINDFIWNDRRNLNEILSLNASFKIYNLNKGGRSFINFLNYNYYTTEIFRDGISLTDPFNPNFDAENISVNEIEKIEFVSPVMSFLYGQYSLGKLVNIVSKDVISPNMFSQLRFTQDRDGALYADVHFTYPISRKLNISLGLNNHGSDGNYSNTQFSLWRGRFRLNFFPSNKFNIMLNYYQNKFQRGMNDGVYENSKDTLMNYTLAKSKNIEAYENNWNYFGNAIINMKIFNNNLSQLVLYSQNNLREFNDLENISNTNEIYEEFKTHSVKYGIKFLQNWDFAFSKNIVLNLQGAANWQYNSATDDLFYKFSQSPIPVYDQNLFKDYKYIDIYLKGSFTYNKLFLTGGMKNQNFEGVNLVSYGYEGKYKISFENGIDIDLKGGYRYAKSNILLSNYGYNTTTGNYTKNYFTNTLGNKFAMAGMEVMFKNFAASADFYLEDDYFDFKTAEYKINFELENFTFKLSLATLPEYKSAIKPRYSISNDISYHNYFFKNKLNLHIGIITRYDDVFYSPEYLQDINKFSDLVSQKSKIFNMDIYIGARIGKANISLVFANIFNNLNYDVFIYPYDNRGGFLNSLSRFTITWDFWN